MDVRLYHSLSFLALVTLGSSSSAHAQIAYEMPHFCTPTDLDPRTIPGAHYSVCVESQQSDPCKPSETAMVCYGPSPEMDALQFGGERFHSSGGWDSSYLPLLTSIRPPTYMSPGMIAEAEQRDNELRLNAAADNLDIYSLRERQLRQWDQQQSQ